MNTNKLYPRFAARRLKEALADTPVVLIHGPRQCGKTTLARLVGDPLGYSYFSFDDQVLAGAAETYPPFRTQGKSGTELRRARRRSKAASRRTR